MNPNADIPKRHQINISMKLADTSIRCQSDDGKIDPVVVGYLVVLVLISLLSLSVCLVIAYWLGAGLSLLNCAISACAIALAIRDGRTQQTINSEDIDEWIQSF